MPVGLTFLSGKPEPLNPNPPTPNEVHRLVFSKFAKENETPVMSGKNTIVNKSPARPSVFAIVLVALALAAPAANAQTQDADVTEYEIRAGFLKCGIGSGWGLIFGSTRRVNCIFSGSGGEVVERYRGHIDSFGVDVGFRKHGIMIWAVFATTSDMEHSSLEGTYFGVSADASLGLGVGGKILVGGSGESFALQPVSIEGTTGLNIAAGVAKLTLIVAD